MFHLFAVIAGDEKSSLKVDLSFRSIALGLIERIRKKNRQNRNLKIQDIMSYTPMFYMLLDIIIL
jgi:hypothetical protein